MSDADPSCLKVYLVDINSAVTDAAKAVGWDETVTVLIRDVVTIAADFGVAFVAPTSSRGRMDYGVCATYGGALFPGIDSRVAHAVSAIGVPDRVGGTYLPVGQAIKVDDLIVAPTMMCPQSVSGTSNAFYAMSAALWAAHRSGVRVLVVPGLCTGVGGMDPDIAVSQMEYAHELFLAGEHHDTMAVTILHKQPAIPDNADFFEVV